MEILIAINENIYFSIASLGSVNPAISYSYILQIRLVLVSWATAAPSYHTYSTSLRSVPFTAAKHISISSTLTMSLSPAQTPFAPVATASIFPRPSSPVTDKSQAIISPNCPQLNRSNPFPCCCGALLCQNPKLKERILPFHIIHTEAGFGDNYLKNYS